jgi:hypothetical protein
MAVPNALGGLANTAVLEAGVVALTPDTSGTDLVSRTGLEHADLYAAIVPQDSMLYKAGLRPGDKILRLNGESVPAWSSMLESLRAEVDRAHELEFWSAGEGIVKTGRFQIRREDFTDDRGQAFAKYVLSVKHWVPLAPKSAWIIHSGEVRIRKGGREDGRGHPLHPGGDRPPRAGQAEPQVPVRSDCDLRACR